MKKRVLVAEDHPGIRPHVIKTVRAAGFECIGATNGKEAFEIFKSQAFDLIIMDGSMPVMDGFQATEKIRAHERGKGRTPIILHSALTGSEVLQRCEACGIDEFVPKSTMKYLMVAVKRYLRPKPRNS